MKQQNARLWVMMGAAFAGAIGLGCGDVTSTDAGRGCASDASCGSDAGVDGGVDGGVDAGFCTFGSCATGTCNLTTSQCETRACNANNQEPDVCAPGQYCASNAQCYEVPYQAARATCPNFTVGTGRTPVWTPAATGPIIYDVQKTVADTTWCPGSTPADISVLLSAYHRNGTFAATGATFPASTLFYVRADGSQCDVAACSGQALFRPQSGYMPSVDRKQLTLKINFCGVTGSSLSAGFYFTNGNEYCASIPK